MVQNSKKIVVIVPAFNEQDCIVPFVEEFERVVFENPTLQDSQILFVDDGSTDSTKHTLCDICAKNASVSYISFSRNFGKEAAILAGLKEAKKAFNPNYFVLIDADLQDPPALLPEMFEFLENNPQYAHVGTRRSTRKGEPPVRSFFARRFYKLMNKFSQVELVDGARDYQLMNRAYVDAIISCGEYNRFFKGLSQWVGFKTHWIEYENIERTNGETKWSFRGLLGYSIEGMVAFSTWPLRFISVAGLILSFISLIALIVVFIRALIIGDPVAGWPSLTCILLLLGGLLLTSLGVIGLYFEKAYLEVKHRPIYIIEESNI